MALLRPRGGRSTRSRQPDFWAAGGGRNGTGKPRRRATRWKNYLPLWGLAIVGGTVMGSGLIGWPAGERSAAATTGTTANFSLCKWGGGSNCVVDGDTFWIGGVKVRIAGIDAPETHPSRCPEEARLGDAATDRLLDLLNSGPVALTSIDRDRDRYGRLLRNVEVSGRDVGDELVSEGVARPYGRGRRPWCGAAKRRWP